MKKGKGTSWTNSSLVSMGTGTLQNFLGTVLEGCTWGFLQLGAALKLRVVAQRFPRFRGFVGCESDFEGTWEVEDNVSVSWPIKSRIGLKLYNSLLRRLKFCLVCFYISFRCAFIFIGDRQELPRLLSVEVDLQLPIQLEGSEILRRNWKLLRANQRISTRLRMKKIPCQQVHELSSPCEFPLYANQTISSPVTPYLSRYWPKARHADAGSPFEGWCIFIRGI